MRLKSVDLKNVCQHRDISLELPVGVTGIFGANGAGKSNLIKMIKASLTGDFPNGRKSNICRLDYVDDYPKGFESSIQTTWEHAGLDVSITRGLKPNKDKMDLAHTSLEKTRDINEHVEKTFGLSSKLINEFIFVDQWSIFQFLSATPASRAKIFSHLCGTERIEKLWTVLGDQIRNDSPLLASDATSFSSLEESMETVLKGNKKEINKLTRQIKLERANLVPDDIKAYRQAIVDHNAAERLHQITRVQQEELANVNEALADLPDVSDTPDPFELREKTLTASSLESDIDSLREKLIILKEGCPTCGHEVESDEEYKRISKPMRQEGARKRQQLEAIQSEIADLSVVIDEAAKIKHKRAPLEKRRDALVASVESTSASSDKMMLEDDHYEEVQAKIESHDKSGNFIALAESKIETLQFENDRLVAQLDDIKNKKKTSKIAKSWIDDLEQLREVFHRDSLPKILAGRFLESLVIEINKTLDSFETPFVVTADDDLSFLAHKPTGVVEPAERLSGGEKVVLAIAFRLAINSLFVGEVGMMVLDEPTAGLDEHNLSCLADVLSRLCDLTRKKGQQIIMITHEARLQRVFDNVIHLGIDANEN